jgi:lactoylglutathione lyase
MEHAFDHVGLSVADLDAMTAWYGGTLGLTTELEFELPGGILRGVMLRSPDGYRLELLHRPDGTPGPGSPTPYDAAAVRSFGHIAFDVPDVDAAYDELIAAGATDRLSPRPSPEPGVRVAFVADPEGNVVSLAM